MNAKMHALHHGHPRRRKYLLGLAANDVCSRIPYQPNVGEPNPNIIQIQGQIKTRTKKACQTKGFV